MGYGRGVARRHGARTLRWILPAVVRVERRHCARIRVDPDIASPMERLRLHVAPRFEFGARAAVCARSRFAGVAEQPLQCAYRAFARRRKEPLAATPTRARPRPTRFSSARRFL